MKPPRKGLSRKTRLRSGTKRLATSAFNPKSRRSRSKPISRAKELIDPRSEIKARLKRVVSKIVTFGITRCPTCTNIKRGPGGNGWNMTNSHVFPCRVDATAFDVYLGGNCVPQCLNCNVYHSQVSSERLLTWFKKTHGQDKLAIVGQRWNQNQSQRIDVVDLEQKLVLCKQILELLATGRLMIEDLIVNYETGEFALPPELR